jgi:hypothetical protein
MLAQKAGSARRKPFTVSLFGQLALAGAVITYLFSTTFDPSEENHFFVMILILIAGVVLSFIMVGVRFVPFNTKSLLSDLLSTAVSFGSIWLIDSFTPAAITTGEMGTSPIGQVSFGILAGVAEGWFFHLWLVGWISQIATPFVGVPASSFSWAIFHLARYGGDMSFIWVIFIVGLPLGFLTLYFRSNDGPTFGHMLANLLIGIGGK